MLAKLTQTAAPLGAGALERATHAVLVLPFARKLDGLRDVPALERLRAALKRRDMKAEDLAKTPVTINLAGGGLCSFVMLDGGKSMFDRQSLLRRAMAPLMEEQPRELTLALFGSGKACCLMSNELRRSKATGNRTMPWIAPAASTSRNVSRSLSRRRSGRTRQRPRLTVSICQPDGPTSRNPSPATGDTPNAAASTSVQPAGTRTGSSPALVISSGLTTSGASPCATRSTRRREPSPSRCQHVAVPIYFRPL